MTTQPRLARLTLDQLDDRQRAIYQSITGGRRSQGPRLFELQADDGALHGPFNALLHSPSVGAAISALGEAIRYETGLSARVREIVILTVAAARRDEFEWYAHRAIAESLSINPAALDALSDGRLAELAATGGDPDLLEPDETAAHALAAAMMSDDPTKPGAAVPDEVWDRAVELLGGVEAAVEVTATVGYYLMLSTMMAAHQVGLPPGVQPSFSQASP